MSNQVDLYHSGDLGDTVYAIPALRRLAYPAHLILYPNPGVTRQVMDENNANMLLPLLNIQNGVSGSWLPAHGPDGLRLEFAVRRFYRNGMNLADIHSNFVGHDHWAAEEPWLVVDKPDYRYPIVIARSARYRNDRFPWKEYYRKFDGRACFVGVPWEHEDFEKNIGPIPHIQTPSLLEVAQLMAGADLVIANQSCPRAVAEALKVPIIVEQGNPANTHFGREYAWYLSGDKTPVPPKWTAGVLENIWCKNAAKKANGRTEHDAKHLEEIARLTRYCRDIEGDAVEIGCTRGGTAAVIAYATQRETHIYMGSDLDNDAIRFLRVYRTKINCKTPVPETPCAFIHFGTLDINAELAGHPIEYAVEQIAPGGIVCFSGIPFSDLKPFLPKLGTPLTASNAVHTDGLYAFRPKG